MKTIGITLIVIAILLLSSAVALAFAVMLGMHATPDQGAAAMIVGFCSLFFFLGGLGLLDSLDYWKKKLN